MSVPVWLILGGLVGYVIGIFVGIWIQRAADARRAVTDAVTGVCRIPGWLE